MDRLRSEAARQPSLPPEEMEKRRAAYHADFVRRECDAAIRQLAGELGPRYSPTSATLDRFNVYHPAQKPILERLRALATRLPEVVAEGRGIILYGAVGTGKDHLLAALLYLAAGAGVGCRWLNGQEAYGTMRDRMDKGLEEEEFFRGLCSPQVLAISDPVPPVGTPSAWNISQLYRLFDRRYRLLRPTWVSLNAKTPEDVEHHLSAPLWDRLRHGAELFPCFWPSYRQAAKAQA